MRDEERLTNRVDGVIHGNSLQAGTIHGDVHLHAREAAPPPPEMAGAVENWADLPEPPAGIRSLLRAQAPEAQDFPYRLRGARRPSLAEVYVRQDLGTGIEEPVDQPQPEPILDERGQVVETHRAPVARVVVRPPTRTVREALDTADHVIVTGGPGQGKSTLSLRLAATLTTRWRNHPAESDEPLTEPVVPLRLTARELATRLGSPFPEALAETARAEYGALLDTSFDARLLRDRVAGCRWLLLVDGLDEVADGTERDRLVTVLATWGADVGSPYRVVLTTRPIDGATLAPLQRAGAGRYELQPFDEAALRHFAENWFGDEERAGRLLRQLRAAHLDELVRVPLLATIAAIVFEQNSDRPLPDNRYQLYEAYLKFLRSAHPEPEGPFTAAYDPLLEHLGRIRLETDTSLIAAAQDWAEQHLTGLTGEWHEELITYLAAVGPLTRRGDDLRFLHHSFAEHLAATAKARLLPEEFDAEDPAFAHLLHGAHPQEGGKHSRAVLLHYTRLHPAQADTLITWLHHGDGTHNLLAARLLATHVPASEDVVDAFLETVGKWALTTHYQSEGILSQASRAAHHPGLADWLIALTHNESAPWASRVEAAAALATRLRGSRGCEAATSLLRTVVEDASINLSHRLAAAEALSDCGSAERRLVEVALRSILAEEFLSGKQCRTAAVLLATFEGRERTYAIECLMKVMNDPWSADADTMAAATGLAEISVDHHPRCAGAFRDVLSRSAPSTALLRAAVFGMASLGGGHVSEAAAALARLAQDSRLRLPARAYAGRLLGQLGSQHRPIATRLLSGLAENPILTPSQRGSLGSTLVDHGLPQLGLELLRSVLDDRSADADDRYWAARWLADLGPEHRAEAARVLTRVATDPTAFIFNQMGALGRLANLGEPYKTPAVAALRAALSDPMANPDSQIWAAQELIPLGPGFHSEILEHIRATGESSADLSIKMDVLRLTRDLDRENGKPVAEAMRNLCKVLGIPSRETHRDYFRIFSDSDVGLFSENEIQTIALDSRLTGAIRLGAVLSLGHFGRQFRHTALGGAVALMNDPTAPPGVIESLVADFHEYGVAARSLLLRALRNKLEQPNLSELMLCDVARAIDHVDRSLLSDAVKMLRTRFSSEWTSAPRWQIGRTLAKLDPDCVPKVVDLMVEGETSRWQRELLLTESLASLTLLIDPLRKLVRNRDTVQVEREIAAALLTRVDKGSKRMAVAELRSQANDSHLDFSCRTDASSDLAMAVDEEVNSSLAFHRAVFDDRSQPIRDRCEAGQKIALLDPTLTDVILRSMRSWCAEGPVTDRHTAFNWLISKRARSPEVEQLAANLARDPSVGPSTLRSLLDWLSAADREATERRLLADRCATPAERVAGQSRWERADLADEAEAVLREAFDAEETSPGHRVEAAVALAEVSPANTAEAVTRLESLLADPRVEYRARRELAKLDSGMREAFVAEARVAFADENEVWGSRIRAVGLLLDLVRGLSDDLAGFIQEMAADSRLPATGKVNALWALRIRDGLDPVRRIRDDHREIVAARWVAAGRLADYAVEDREVGTRVLDAIATDASTRPTLRWRVARDLVAFGERGRELGAAVLSALVHDDGMPPSVRSSAAFQLGVSRPDLRWEMLSILRGLLTTAQSPARIQAWEAIGRFQAAEAALGLRGMARDHALSPGVRLRAALAMITYNRDFRETAAVVAREVAHDPDCPLHIRFKAARALARLSDLCLGEARALLRELNAQWPPAGSALQPPLNLS
ncbi:NACHT domain-containing protein [Actinokineospora spheciospongiae]|uniref:NACHT domain-containing protein n=1 Tax=Actinokineospora spheciospongiae TaxID=909613 RepID=UPI000D712577|nr:NACHT domain-containing protein [Actinokineospora spheciospongiae]PWW66684.1 NACHT domain-containing protein [Actinokineospora spheciospongiae]